MNDCSSRIDSPKDGISSLSPSVLENQSRRPSILDSFQYDSNNNNNSNSHSKNHNSNSNTICINNSNPIIKEDSSKVMEQDTMSVLSLDNISSVDNDSIGSVSSFDSNVWKRSNLSPTHARRIRLSKSPLKSINLTKKSSHGAPEVNHHNSHHLHLNDTGSVKSIKSIKSMASTSTLSSVIRQPSKVKRNQSYEVIGRDKKDYTSFFSQLDDKSLEMLHTYDTADALEDVAEKLELTKCVSYLTPDAISWMNKRHPNAINDKTHHYSHITPSRALQLLAIFRGLDYDNSGEISKQELQDALKYVMISTQRNKIVDPVRRRSSVFGGGNGSNSSMPSTSRRGSSAFIMKNSVRASLEGTNLSTQYFKGHDNSIVSITNQHQHNGSNNPFHRSSAPVAVISNDNLSKLFDSMDVDGDGMVDFNEFVLQLTSTKNSSGIDSEKLEQAFYEFAMTHQRQTIIDLLNDKNSKLSDTEKYLQLRKLFKMELLRQETVDGSIEDQIKRMKNDAEKQKVSVLTRKHHQQRLKEKQRARYALVSIREEKLLNDITTSKLYSNHQIISSHFKSIRNIHKNTPAERRSIALAEMDVELNQFLHGKGNRNQSLVGYHRNNNKTNDDDGDDDDNNNNNRNSNGIRFYKSLVENNIPDAYHKAKEITHNISQKMSIFPIIPNKSKILSSSNKNNVNHNQILLSSLHIRLQAMDDIQSSKHIGTFHGVKLPPLRSIREMTLERLSLKDE